MKALYLWLPMLISVSLLACSSNHKEVIEPDIQNVDSMKLKISVGQRVLTATMYDNPTSKDFVSLLPLTLSLTDYSNNEKISDLPRRLSTQGAPAGYKPSAGDITIYAPWGNLAVFYKDGGYASGLIPLGKLDGGIDVFNVPGPVQVKIELLQ